MYIYYIYASLILHTPKIWRVTVAVIRICECRSSCRLKKLLLLHLVCKPDCIVGIKLFSEYSIYFTSHVTLNNHCIRDLATGKTSKIKMQTVVFICMYIFTLNNHCIRGLATGKTSKTKMQTVVFICSLFY